MQRLIDTDALIEKCGEWYVEEGPEDGFIGTIKQLLESQPIVHVSDKDADTISRQAAIEDVGDGVYTGSKIRRWLKSLPSIQPKGTRLSTVCLLCKKPAVTFNTEDDIPYTNYSYCEDCLRKGLKLLREQKKNLQTQPEQRWIPCSERQPDKEGDYLVTLLDDGRTWVEIALWNETFGGRWQAVLYNDVDYSDISNVIAWKPLPEPYQEGGE